MGMEHHQRDAYAAHERKTSGYRPGWHPVLSTVEVEPGAWEMVTQYGDRYAIIRLLEIGGERGYRVVTGDADAGERRLIGYYRTLRTAAERGHKHWLAAQARPGGINGR